MSAPPELVALLDGHVVGAVRQDRQGRLSFAYDDSWRDSPRGYPLSLSMPLARREHGDDAVRPYLDGLLPDNETILARWAAQFHVSARNPFALLAHVGEDCPGAVQFAPPDRAAQLAGADGPVRWLKERDVEALLRELRTRSATGRRAGDPGYFSLPGAQPKTALLHQGGRWGIPSGRTPTTHILKPPMGDLDGFAENEHLCLRLAIAVGLPTTGSRVVRFGGEVAIVIERYDRVAVQGRIARIHQEDFCQALGVPSRIKYQAEGGPGVRDVVRVLRECSTAPDEDAATFVDALALNWVIGGTDAHAKNYSVLIAPGQVRLAPLYDLASVLPYPRQIPPRKAKVAMRIGREYHLWKIGRMDWERLGQETGMGNAVVERVRAVAEAAAGAIGEVCTQARADSITHPVVDVLEQGIRKNAAACLAALDRSSSS